MRVVTVERFDTENAVLSIPNDVLSKLNCKIGDEFHVAVVQPNVIVLTKSRTDAPDPEPKNS